MAWRGSPSQRLRFDSRISWTKNRRMLQESGSCPRSRNRSASRAMAMNRLLWTTGAKLGRLRGWRMFLLLALIIVLVSRTSSVTTQSSTIGHASSSSASTSATPSVSSSSSVSAPYAVLSSAPSSSSSSALPFDRPSGSSEFDLPLRKWTLALSVMGMLELALLVFLALCVALTVCWQIFVTAREIVFPVSSSDSPLTSPYLPTLIPPPDRTQAQPLPPPPNYALLYSLPPFTNTSDGLNRSVTPPKSPQHPAPSPTRNYLHPAGTFLPPLPLSARHFQSIPQDLPPLEDIEEEDEDQEIEEGRGGEGEEEGEIQEIEEEEEEEQEEIRLVRRSAGRRSPTLT